MEKKSSNSEILEAVNFFLNNEINKEIPIKKKDNPILPKNTEEIILQAEKYLKD